jgi:hypothetical protein
MRIAGATIAVLIVLGAVALRYGYTRGELAEWVATNLPYPGTGLSTSDTFSLFRGGRFQLEVETLATPQEVEQPTPIKCDLHVTINGPQHFRIERDIRSLRVGSRGGTEVSYYPDDVWVLKPGREYTVTVTGGAVPAVFSERGAVVQLRRLEPVGPDLGIELAVGLGYVLLAGAFILSVIVSVREGLHN